MSELIKKNIFPYGHWKNPENILIVLKKIICQFGYLPHRQALMESEHKYIISAIERHHGNLGKFAKEHKLPFQAKILPPGIWKSWDFVEKELIKSIAMLGGQFPTDNILRTQGMKSLRTAIQKYHGGLIRCNELMERYITSPSKRYITEDGHYFDSLNENCVYKVLKSYSIKHKLHPTIRFEDDFFCIPDFELESGHFIEVLMADYRIDQENQIYVIYTDKYKNKKNHYENAGLMVFEFFPNDFSSPENFKKAINNLMEFIGQSLPISEIPKKCFTIVKSKTSPRGYWKDFSNIEKHLIPICEKLGRFPTCEMMKKNGLGGLYKQIVKLGGVAKIAEKIGYPINDDKRRKRSTIRRKPGSLDEETILKELKKIFDAHNRSLSQYELKALGYKHIIDAINNKSRKKGHSHSKNLSYSDFVQKLGYTYPNPCRRPRGYWCHKENILSELLPIVIELGGMPSKGILRSKGRNDLCHAINRYANWEEIRTCFKNLEFRV